MAALDTQPEDAPKKGGKRGLFIGIVLALILGAGGFFAAFTGQGPFGVQTHSDQAETEVDAPLKLLEQNTYIELDPLIVNIRSSSQYKLLRFLGQLEVKPEHVDDVTLLKPRLMDVMNTYLNALEAARFEDPIALIKLRSQLLRRLQIITGEGRIEDLLIMEFLLQ